MPRRWRDDNVLLFGIEMTYEICTVLCGGPGLKLLDCDLGSHMDCCVRVIDNRDNKLSPCEAYQEILETTTADFLMLTHDDLTIHETGWEKRVLDLFENENCVGVGLGGATGLGHPDLYKVPYRIQNLARRGYASNQTDAEVHGGRFTGVRRAAVLEQFFMAVRVDWLRSRGGWPVKHLTHHGLDMWFACEVARDKKELWQAGVACHHEGGASSTKDIYALAPWLQGGSIASDHQTPHRWIYDFYRDVLPIGVSE
jgi:hypothetical protein